MALNSRGSIDPRWLYHNRGVIRALQLATVEIYNPANGSQVYDVATNAWSGTAVELFAGPARVQPLPASTEAAAAFNPTSFQMVRVQISYDANTITGGASMPDIRPNDRLRVTAAPYNTSLEKFIYVVTSVLNSSNNWERTLLCRVDIELDPTEV